MEREMLKTRGRGYLREHSLGAGGGSSRDNGGPLNIGLRLGFEEIQGHGLQRLEGGRG